MEDNVPYQMANVGNFQHSEMSTTTDGFVTSKVGHLKIQSGSNNIPDNLDARGGGGGGGVLAV